MIGKISVFASETDDGKGWIEARLRESIGLTAGKEGFSWPRLRGILKSLLWIDILHDAPGEKIFESISR